MPRIRIETQRLVLRNTQEGDIPALVSMWMDPQVTRHMGGPRDRGWLEKNFSDDAQNVDPPLFDQWPVIDKLSGQLVGYCGLLDKDVEGRAEVELVYALVPAAWGRGFATEIALALRQHAVRAMGLRRLIALVEPENEASIRVAERVGFHADKAIMRGDARRIMYVYEEPPGESAATSKGVPMSVKHATDVKANDVAAGKDTTIQVLISSKEGPNFAMRRFVMQKGGGMPRHTNTVEHEQYVLRGRAQIGIGGETFEVQAGDVVFIPEGSVHFYQNTGEEPFEFLCIIPNKEDRITIVDEASC